MDYFSKKDSARAGVYGCLLAEEFVAAKKFTQVRLALEKTAGIILGIQGIQEAENTVNALGTAIEVLRRVRAVIHYPMPASSRNSWKWNVYWNKL